MAADMHLKYTIDLDAPLLETPARTLLMEGDDGAQTVSITAMRNGKAADLTGCTAMGAMTVATGETVVFPAQITNNMITAQLPRACYAVPGAYMLLIRLSGGSVGARTILYLTGRVARSGEGPAIDPESVLPSITELREAAGRVEAAVDAAMTVAGMTVQTTTLAAGSSATARYADGVLYLGVPQGATGAGQPYNLLDNSDFRHPVNQRGMTSNTKSAEYMIDRWKAEAANNVAGLVQIANGGIVLSPTDSNYCGIYQLLEHYSELSGKTVTLAVCADGVWYTATFTMGATPSGGVLLSNGLRIYSSSGQHVLIRNPAGNAPVTLSCAALYEGSYTDDTVPAYQTRGYAAELAECMRYYRKFETLQIAPFYVTSDRRQYEIRLMPAMRISPTVTWDANDASAEHNGGWGKTNAALTTASSTAHKIVLQADGAATPTNFQFLYASFTASADL